MYDIICSMILILLLSLHIVKLDLPVHRKNMKNLLNPFCCKSVWKYRLSSPSSGLSQKQQCCRLVLMCPFRETGGENTWDFMRLHGKNHHNNFTVDNGLTWIDYAICRSILESFPHIKGSLPNPLNPPLGSPGHHDVVDPGAFILMPPVAVLVPA